LKEQVPGSTKKAGNDIPFEKRCNMLLGPYIILDMTDYRGQLCGKILADLGGDVWKIEPPGGDHARRMGPFLDDDPHPEKSLYWLAYNTNKRSITLNIEAKEGRDLFLDILKEAKFLIESFDPGFLEALSLSYEDLSSINPSLIMISITPFGRTGPYRDFKDSDAVNMAMGGQMILCGDADRPPLQFPSEQSYPLAGMNAALAGLAAHLYREKTGKGQHIDVSIQESVFQTTFNLHPFWEFQGVSLRREGPKAMRGKLIFRTCWECRDGYISWRLFTGEWGRWTRSLVDWMKGEEEAGTLDDVSWEKIDMNRLSQNEIDLYEAGFADFFMGRTKDDLFKYAQKKDLPLFPVNTLADIIEDKQHEERGFWRDIPYPEWGITIRHPGPAFQLGDNRCDMVRAPRIGEHNNQIYGDIIGLSEETIIRLKQSGVI
jgi:crotonobetainyl-CoA:carnitine CoA-transferase CaiB-like acyl-CoA transferase